MRKEWVVVLVSDIRNFRPMSASLPQDGFSRFIQDWFTAAARIIEGRGGRVDKFLGDAVLAFWVCPAGAADPDTINAALDTANGLIREAEGFSSRLSGDFPGYRFRIGVGVSMGQALMADAEQAETDLAGASVELAFHLESLTKDKKHPVIVGANIAESAGETFRFQGLGRVSLEGLEEPVCIAALLPAKGAERNGGLPA